MTSSKPHPALAPVDRLAEHKFATPSKKINDGNDLSFFFASTAYSDLTKWLLQLNRAVFPTKREDGSIDACVLESPPSFSESIQKVRSILQKLSSLIEDAPPDTGPRRFGNVAFRKWYQLVEQNATELLHTHIVEPSRLSPTGGEQKDALCDELKAYLLGSLGSAQRLDYGTGHELSFLAFLGCLWKLGMLKNGEERAIVVGIIQPYLDLIRRVIMTYTLEPAGSHGVWGLDDHSFLPYIFGSAQLGPPIRHDDYSSPVPTEGSLSSAPSPSSVTNKAMVADFKNSNMYFSAIQFIYDVKKGPFWEHSPVLYHVSGIKDGWGKINKGMLKMYAAEVLGKFPVVQHFPFGSLFRWERDPEVQQGPASIHTQHQPTAMQSKDVPPVASTGTAAPWARPGGTAMPQMPSSTGMPSTRAPWAQGTAPGRPPGPTGSTMGTTAAPWASRDRPR